MWWGNITRITKLSKSLFSKAIQCDRQRFFLSTTCFIGSPNHNISRYPSFDENDMSGLPEDIQERMNEVKEKGGFLPNVFKVLAYRPDEFRAFFDYYDVLMEKNETLTKAEKEMIVVATSVVNRCNYCLTAHGALLRIYSKNPLLGDQVAFDYQFADITNRQKTMLSFAVEVAKGQPISDQQISNMESAGFTSDEIWDIGAIAGFFALSNRMAHLTRMKPNDEFYLLGRIPKEKK